MTTTFALYHDKRHLTNKIYYLNHFCASLHSSEFKRGPFCPRKDEAVRVILIQRRWPADICTSELFRNLFYYNLFVLNDQNRTLEGATNTGHFTHAFSALHRGFVTYRQTVFLLKHSSHKRIGSLVFDIIGHITQHLPFQQRKYIPEREEMLLYFYYLHIYSKQLLYDFK